MDLATFAAIEQRLADVTSAMLANAYVVLANGQAFGAELNQADEIAFDAVAHGAEVLVYRSCHALQDGEEISINGQSYRVASVPRRRDAHFSECELVRA